jgi:hypothetical protein
MQIIDALKRDDNLRSGSMSRSVHLKQISNLTSGPCGIELDADLAGAHKR